jgi:hypothetical protein
MRNVLRGQVALRTEMEDRDKWLEAGLTDENDSLDRSVGSRFWHATDSVELDSKKIRLILPLMPGRAWPPARIIRLVGPGRDMLAKFVKLAEAPPEAILNYARTWGMLGVCERHNLPSAHNPPPFIVRPLAVGVSSDWCQPQWSNDEGFRESVETWQGFSRLMRALLNIASDLHLNRQTCRGDWHSAFTESPGHLVLLLNELEIENWRFAREYPDMWKEPSETQWQVVERIVNLMLEWGNVRPIFQVTKGTPSIKLGSEGLFGALVVQLMFAISRMDGFAICTACGEPYPPKRRPRIDQRNYCSRPQCVKKRSAATSRDSRKR